MNTLKNLKLAGCAIAALGLVAPALASAQDVTPFIGLRGDSTSSSAKAGVGIGLGIEDGWLLNGAIIGAITDETNFTGLISAGIPDGKGIALVDRDLFGTEGGGPAPSDSDYFYIYKNVVYWDSDSETSLPILTHAVDPSKFLHVYETGKFQDFSAYFGLGPGNTIAIFSDVPEPATWALMLVGFGGLGLALRARRRFAAA